MPSVGDFFRNVGSMDLPQDCSNDKHPMATLTDTLRRLQMRVESFFPPARINRRFVQWIRAQGRRLRYHYLHLRWPRRRILMEKLQAKRAMLVERLENMDESVEQALERSGGHYKDVKGKAKAISDARIHAVRHYATSQLLTNLRPEVSGKVLDIACNTGLLSIVIKSEHPPVGLLRGGS